MYLHVLVHYTLPPGRFTVADWRGKIMFQDGDVSITFHAQCWHSSLRLKPGHSRATTTKSPFIFSSLGHRTNSKLTQVYVDPNWVNSKMMCFSRNTHTHARTNERAHTHTHTQHTQQALSWLRTAAVACTITKSINCYHSEPTPNQTNENASTCYK